MSAGDGMQRSEALPACPRCGDPGFVNPTTGERQCGNAACEHTDLLPQGEVLTVEEQLAGAVSALGEVVRLLGSGSDQPNDTLARAAAWSVADRAYRQLGGQ